MSTPRGPPSRSPRRRVQRRRGPGQGGQGQRRVQGHHLRHLAGGRRERRRPCGSTRPSASRPAVPARFAGPLETARQLRQVAPTVQRLIARGAKVTMCGHQGPLGLAGDAERYARTAEALRQLYPEEAVAPNLSEWDWNYEDPARLASLLEGLDLYVNDDFQHSSASLSSIIVPPTTLPSAAGRQLQADLGLLVPYLAEPEHPPLVVLGSRDTLDCIRNLYSLVLRTDAGLVGGQMSQPFLEAIGWQPPGERQTSSGTVAVASRPPSSSRPSRARSGTSGREPASRSLTCFEGPAASCGPAHLARWRTFRSPRAPSRSGVPPQQPCQDRARRGHTSADPRGAPATAPRGGHPQRHRQRGRPPQEW